MRFERGDHMLFKSRNDKAFMDRMVDTIETGTSNEGKYSVTEIAKESFYKLTSFTLATPQS